MKTYYRVGPGRFVSLDSHVQPWWRTLSFYLRPRPHLGAFLTSFVLSLGFAIFAPTLFR